MKGWVRLGIWWVGVGCLGLQKGSRVTNILWLKKKRNRCTSTTSKNLLIDRVEIGTHRKKGDNELSKIFAAIFTTPPAQLHRFVCSRKEKGDGGKD